MGAGRRLRKSRQGGYHGAGGARAGEPRLIAGAATPPPAAAAGRGRWPPKGGRTVQSAAQSTPAAGSRAPGYWSSTYPHDVWMQRQGIPIHKGYFIEDLRTVDLGWWEARQCQAAFIQLQGQQGV